MTAPVIAMSTREWQRAKLGPSLRREMPWILIDVANHQREITRALDAITVAATNAAAALADLAGPLARLAQQIGADR